MKKFNLKKMVVGLVMAGVVTFALNTCLLTANAEVFQHGDVEKYTHLIEKYPSDNINYVYNNVVFDKENTDSDKKRRPNNWSYVFKYNSKDQFGENTVKYTSISQKYWKVSNTGEPKEDAEYILVLYFNENPPKGESNLQTIDAIEVTKKATKPVINTSKPQVNSNVNTDECKTSFRYSKLSKKWVKSNSCDE